MKEVSNTLTFIVYIDERDIEGQRVNPKIVRAIEQARLRGATYLVTEHSSLGQQVREMLETIARVLGICGVPVEIECERFGGDTLEFHVVFPKPAPAPMEGEPPPPV
ncbi:MAG TPA: hypothetical protein VJJ24_00445 [Candidatus Paceibacterota bacterium]|uniref:Uncharacterized protein n=1 Tax=Candidatus Wolfebacteria bacterium RIFCSPLOWO2_01_FULL_47_17b TaxID=1802558 RepID=A0A1F8DYA0_9BACT|nr:MAG: hypothetical protein A2935_04205 [Candidatus Wolfebacteria bacterium RIFCSPLOWO2_01_FULL_47_17b]